MTQGSTLVFGTSWLFDLMQAATGATAGAARANALQFNGAGSLGVSLNLGINPLYIAEKNQQRVDSKDVILGITKPAPNSTVPTGITGDGIAAFTNSPNSLWNYNNAVTLSAALDNVNQYATGPFLVPNSNSTGVNNQKDALRDFLAFYTATQNEGTTGSDNNGSWEELRTKIVSNGDKDQILKALFGDGKQATGLIDQTKVRLGGTAATLGGQLGTDLTGASALSGKALGLLMGNTQTQAQYALWVKPLQAAMTEFNINTPKRIAAFLAQIRAEGGLTAKPESFAYTPQPAVAATATRPARPAQSTAQRLADIFTSAFNFRFNRATHPDALYRTGLRADDYNDQGRTTLENAELFVTDIIAPALAASGGVWNDSVQRLIANRVYSSDHGTGFERGNGLESTGEGWTYRGHGQLQLTGPTVILAFARYVRDSGPAAGQTAAEAVAEYQSIIANTNLLDTNLRISARSAAWHWQEDLRLNAPADALNEAIVPWTVPVTVGTTTTYNNYTETITRRIATHRESFLPRWVHWQRNIGLAYVGGNPYESIRDVLSRIGINAVNARDYETQFGFSLRAPKVLEIGGGVRALLATAHADYDTTAPIPSDHLFNDPMQALLTQARNALGLNEGDYTMFFPDQPVAAPIMPAIVMVAQATKTQKSTIKREHNIGMCYLLNRNRGDGSQADLYPIPLANQYFVLDIKANTTLPALTFGRDAKITVLQQPKNGKVEPISADDNWSDSRYVPNSNYEGYDSAILLVEGNGYKIKLSYFFNVTNADGYKLRDDPRCIKFPEGGYGWKISNLPTPIDLASQQRSNTLDAILAAASEALTNFAVLAGTAVGQTTGEGLTAQITLDTTAANHGWFIDPTPTDNSEYLPTSDSNVWQAKPGSEAEGKMDMLSVLLHEYGHALGFSHSTNNADFMATSLVAGERRLPTADELTLMSQLIAQLKGDPTDPTTPAPFDPTAPLGGSLGLLALGRLRRNDYGGWSVAINSTTLLPQASSANYQTQYQAATNATLTNAALASTTGNGIDSWRVEGNVTVNANSGNSNTNPTNNTVTLAESTTAHAHLSQGFTLNTTDRYLVPDRKPPFF